MRSEKILVVDDDPSVRRLIWKALQATGVLIYQSESIDHALDMMKRISFDLFLLDVSLEYENDGFQLAQLIREQSPLTPIIFISGRKEETDIVNGLEAGGDLYLTKPFSALVLKAQVTSILNRTERLLANHQQQNEAIVSHGIFRFDKNLYQFSKNSEIINMTSKEIMMMLFFMENPYQVFSKEQIYANVWSNGDMDQKLIVVYINYLRNKIEEEPKTPHYLQTVWGIGYSFHPEPKRDVD